MTSAVVKAYPSLVVNTAILDFRTGTTNGVGVVRNVETFWRGVDRFFFFAKRITELNGTAFSYTTQTGTNSYTFTSNIEMPGYTVAQVRTAIQPLFTELTALGIRLPTLNPVASKLFAPSTREGRGSVPANRFIFSSRLFPAKNWNNETLFRQTITAIRQSVEAGYVFRGINLAPTLAKAGYPGNNAANPAWRTSLMHADSFNNGVTMRGRTPAELEAAHARHDGFVDRIRAVTPSPEGGAYVNEADHLESGWQTSFYGANYNRLVQIKRARDPWGLFWAETTPGSEAWAVRKPNWIPSQNGRLCRTGV